MAVTLTRDFMEALIQNGQGRDQFCRLTKRCQHRNVFERSGGCSSSSSSFGCVQDQMTGGDEVVSLLRLLQRAALVHLQNEIPVCLISPWGL